MALYSFYLDIQEGCALYWEVKTALQNEGQIVFDDYIEGATDFVIRPPGRHTPFKGSLGQILVGDFSFPQTVPKNAICVDCNTGIVQNAGLSWDYYLKEFLGLERIEV